MKKVDLSIFYPKKPRADDGEPVVLPFYVKALIVAACLAIAFTCGFFLGQDRSHNVIIEPSAVVSSEPASAIVPSGGQDGAELRSLPSPDESESDGRININTASVSELMTLPGIGEGLARRIVEYRDAHGPFAAPENITDVNGIGEARLRSIIDLIKV